MLRPPSVLRNRFHVLPEPPLLVEHVEKFAIDVSLDMLNPLRRERHAAVVVIRLDAASVDVEPSFHRLGVKSREKCVAAEVSRIEVDIDIERDRAQADIAAITRGRVAHVDH